MITAVQESILSPPPPATKVTGRPLALIYLSSVVGQQHRIQPKNRIVPNCNNETTLSNNWRVLHDQETEKLYNNATHTVLLPEGGVSDIKPCKQTSVMFLWILLPFLVCRLFLSEWMTSAGWMTPPPLGTVLR